MLLEQLKLPTNQPAFLLADGSHASRGDLSEWSASPAVRDWRMRFIGGNIGLCCRENSYLALALLLLDGVAERITLLPAALDSDALVSLAHSAGITCLVSDWIETPPPELSVADLIPTLQFGQSGHQTEHFTDTYPTEWVLPTSGTTRTPKLVAHTVGTLTKSVKRDASKGADLCWGLLYDLNRFAGIQVYLQALLGGASLAIPKTDATLDQKLAFFAQAGCNAISATPTLWRKILMTPGASEIPLKLITLGGEIADQSILSALKNAFPLARVTHIYASTEAGVGFSVTDGLEGFPASYLTGTLSSATLRISKDGILEIQPLISGQKYLAEKTNLTEDDGFVNTGDRVQLRDERVFFLGRDSGAINVGGNKVQPEKIEQTLLTHPEIAMVSVVPKRSGITGALVEARIVLKSGTTEPPTIPMLRQWCVDRLERYEVPAIIRLLDNLETTAAGKISRQ
jgi:acyl-CoA synthetase (AMP-forming)/AMP-acid ligase II